MSPSERVEFLDQLIPTISGEPIRSSNDLRTFRLGVATRSNWPDDLTIELQERSIYVRFEVGDRSLRNEVLQRLEQQLASMGLITHFEEL